MSGGAHFSKDGKRRFSLWRRWDAGPKILWVCLNPSTAGAREEDQTTRKIRGFSERWGYGTYILMNIFDWISTDPKQLNNFPLEELYAPDNFSRITETARDCRTVVCAWGRHGTRLGQGVALKAFLTKRDIKLWCLGKNDDGSPCHPLMLPYNTVLRRL